MQFVLLKCRNVVAMSHFKMLAMEHGKSGGLTKKMLGNRTMVCLKRKIDGCLEVFFAHLMKDPLG